jgi:hypothetical protein
MVNPYFGLARPEPLMPQIVADPLCRPVTTCFRLFPGPGIQEFQLLGPDPYLAPRATLRQPAQPLLAVAHRQCPVGWVERKGKPIACGRCDGFRDAQPTLRVSTLNHVIGAER